MSHQDPDTSHLKGAAEGSGAIPPATPYPQYQFTPPTPGPVPVPTPTGYTEPPVDMEFEIAAASFIRAYNELAAIIHDDNVRKGFWPKVKSSRNVGEAFMLVVSEIGEAMEADRKDLQDQHLPHLKGVEVEMADAIIRVMDLGQGLQWQVAEALRQKLLYNRSRPFKHGKKY